MKNVVFWDVALCDFVRTDVWEECIASIIRVTRLGGVFRLLVTSNIVPSSPIFVTLMMGAIRSSETSVLNKQTLHCVTSQKTAFFIFTAMKTANLP
jgi:hypothetical protein